jgi:hypothetical protein
MNADARRLERNKSMSYLRASAFICGYLCCLLIASRTRAEETELEPIQIGSPTKLEVFPAQVKLSGKRQRQQLVVTGHYADGTVQDLTRAATYASSATNVAAIENSVLKPVANGTAEITVSAGGQSAKVAVEVVNFDQPDPLSFEQHALAALSKQGCNAGACGRSTQSSMRRRCCAKSMAAGSIRPIRMPACCSPSR